MAQIQRKKPLRCPTMSKKFNRCFILGFWENLPFMIPYEFASKEWRRCVESRISTRIGAIRDRDGAGEESQEISLKET
ncbi:hypothetical protein AKJ16_DCAP15317 [Drosera capensis]